MRFVPALAALLYAAPALASSPAAWRAGDASARRVCLAASGLGGARIVAEPVRFDDRLPLDALLVRGRLTGRWAAGKPVTMLCLYDRRTKAARAVEALGWPVATR